MEQQYFISYTSSQHTTSRVFTVSTDIKALKEDVYIEFANTDGDVNYTIDEIALLNKDVCGVDYTQLLREGNTINIDILRKIQKDETLPFKIAFLSYTYHSKDIEDIHTLNVDVKDIVFGDESKYPGSWLLEQAGIYYKNLLRELKKAEADHIFGESGWAHLFEVQEINGILKTQWFGNTFVWRWGKI